MNKLLKEGWLFNLQSPSQNLHSLIKAGDLWARDYDDSSWKKVSVPFDWATSYPFSKENSSGTGYLPGGTGWYRCHFNSDDMKGKRVRVCFDGVYKHARVWCNGYFFGNHQNGFTSFEFDITESIKTDGTENVLAVRVSHEDIADCRWYTGSGIMRPVTLKITDDCHLTDDGVFFYSKDNKQIYVDTTVANDGYKNSAIEVTVTLTDKDGKTVYTRTQKGDLAAQEKAVYNFTSEIKDVHVWCPEDPYLYDLTVQVLADGKESDVYTTKAGIRDLRFDADKGFFCNGKSYKFKGLCVHEDAGCWGNAVPKDVWARRLKKLQDAGCNAIRMSHNPHSDELYQLCDEMGFFVMDEIYDEWQEPKNKWWQGHNVYPPSHQGITDDFISCYKEDCRSFVVRRRNHPCVVMYSIGNEIDYPNDPYCSPKFKEMTGNNDASKPAAERQYNPNHPDIGQIAGIAKMLSAQVKLWDTTRPVTMALAFPELSSDTGVTDALDVIGYNYKEQFYAEDHKRFSDKMFVGSENSHSIEAWHAVTDNEYIAGQFLWTGIDYLGEAHGWPIHGSYAGLLTLAGFEKPMYWFRKALWTEEKFCKIFTAVSEKDYWNRPWLANWNYAAGSKVDVRVYTNEKEVELFINGKSCGKADAVKKGYAEFTVDYEEGEITAKAAESGDVVVTTGAAVALKVNIVPGDEVQQLEVSVVDDLGNVVSNDSSLIKVEVEGAELFGLENGDLADVTEYSASYRHVYNGCLIAYVRGLKDSVAHVSFKCAGKAPAIVDVKL
ncbi:glycoside hydrolase family 2 protein [Treponema sp.]|uniref:glycoside hydrolase family 2 protein n=1 Tax=Treponema sp. TaxID=166 RepID=UPI0025F5B3C1|nr:glycoside hydrolase family 2 TIM barrel-domain containing protein [Treponema sp.]MCR5217695.1 DUF4982 domain-containing protein [Treponema sp.]